MSRLDVTKAESNQLGEDDFRPGGCDLQSSNLNSDPKGRTMKPSYRLALLILPILSATAFADDWPQWNGPGGKGIVTEDDIIDTVPASGLKAIWRKPVSYGFSGPAVANGLVYVTDYVRKSGEITNNPSKRDELTGQERILCFNAKTGEQVWEHKYDRDYAVSYPGGPRVVPTIHNGQLYAIGAEGNLTCLNAKTGDVRWKHDFAKEYGAETPLWGHSAPPLVYKGTLICLVGGKGSLIVAFDLETGKEKWKTLSSEEGEEGTGYCPPTIIKHGGVDQLLVWSPTALYSLNPDTRKVYWQFGLNPGYRMSILPPMLDGNMLYTAGESQKSLMLELDPAKPAAKEVWRGNPRNSVYFATNYGHFESGYIYGADINGMMVCARASDGKRMWQTTQLTMGKENQRKANHTSAFTMKLKGDKYLMFTDAGDVVSATMNPEGYKETGRFHAIEPTENIYRRTVVWTYPAISDGSLFLRNGKEIVCFDVGK